MKLTAWAGSLTDSPYWDHLNKLFCLQDSQGPALSYSRELQIQRAALQSLTAFAVNSDGTFALLAGPSSQVSAFTWSQSNALDQTSQLAVRCRMKTTLLFCWSTLRRAGHHAAEAVLLWRSAKPSQYTQISFSTDLDWAFCRSHGTQVSSVVCTCTVK